MITLAFLPKGSSHFSSPFLKGKGENRTMHSFSPEPMQAAFRKQDIALCHHSTLITLTVVRIMPTCPSR
jgi:hypothetical protein